MIKLNYYWAQIDEDNYIIIEGEVELLEQKHDSTRITSMSMKMH
jgi:hypothetical protein